MGLKTFSLLTLAMDVWLLVNGGVQDGIIDDQGGATGSFGPEDFVTDGTWGVGSVNPDRSDWCRSRLSRDSHWQLPDRTLRMKDLENWFDQVHLPPLLYRSAITILVRESLLPAIMPRSIRLTYSIDVEYSVERSRQET